MRNNLNMILQPDFLLHNQGQYPATLAQLVEQSPCKRWVVGSSPTSGSSKPSNRPQPFYLVKVFYKSQQYKKLC